MPGLNDYWSTYGCDNCDDYDLLVLSVNFSDSKSAFANWISQNNCKHPGVYKGEGGTDFKNALNNGNTGGPKYLIYPDKRYKKYPSSSEILNTGIEEHECSTHIKQGIHASNSFKLSINTLHSGRLAIVVPTADTYEISTFNGAGQKVTTFITNLLAGENIVNLNNKNVSSGMIILMVKNSKEQIVERTITIK